jgi:RNA polymerase sigma factor (sigma-70 family)
MMFDATFADKADAQTRVSPYAGSKAMRSRGFRRVTGSGQETDGAATDWAALVLLVRDSSDTAAFAALFRHFSPRLKAYLMKSGATEALAEECVQDVMTTLWQKAHLFDPARASVATWIYTIARNRRTDILRRSRHIEAEDLDWGPEQEPDAAEIYAAQSEARRLGTALLDLPQKQRELIERAYFGEASHSEIANATGLPLGTIKSRLRLALDRLRQQLDPKAAK